MSISPWHRVFALIRSFEDGLVVMWLFEYRDKELLANGVDLEEMVEGFPSERPVAQILVDRVNEATLSSFEGRDLYRPLRGSLMPTESEVEEFVARCASVGVWLHYDDGSSASGREIGEWIARNVG